MEGITTAVLMAIALLIGSFVGFWVSGVWPWDTPDWILAIFGGERMRIM